MKSKPVTRMGWHKHYAGRFNKTQHQDAAHLAIWYLLLHLGLET
jgi:hypothetical protein